MVHPRDYKAKQLGKEKIYQKVPTIISAAGGGRTAHECGSSYPISNPTSVLLVHGLSHLCQVVLCRNPSLGLTRADSYYSAMATLNTALMVQVRWPLENWEADLTANKNLKFWGKENSSEVEKAENKYLRLTPQLKGEVNLRRATHLLLWNCWVAGSKTKKEHPKQRNGVNMFFGGCIQAQETGEAMMEKLTEHEQSTQTSGNRSHFL